MTVAREQEFRGTERFEIQRRLGAGGFGVVYQAYDQDRGSLVALKTLRDANVEALFRLKREFRALADIAHPNLVHLYELLAQDDQWFFTMELIQGVSFLRYVRGEPLPKPGDSTEPTRAFSPGAGSRGPLSSPSMRAHEVFGSAAVALERETGSVPGPAPAIDLVRLREALRQTVAGIHALHAAGQLHRDVKPSNVLVSREGRVVLLDFGMVTDLSPPGSRRSISVVGTPAYMSPEQGSAGPLTQATDWYSVGVMLFEALTGQWPFTGSFVEMMWDKRHKDAPPPHELVAGVPDDLDALCVALMSRDPARRPRGNEILERLGAAHFTAPRASAREPPAGTPPFVGREEHLAALRAALAATRATGAIVVRVHGPSGAGKTALARRFLHEARREGAVVLVGRCYARESVPYKALDSLVDGLSQFLKKLPAADVNEMLPRDVLALAKLFPVLRRVEAVAGARRRVLEIPDSQELRRRAFAALRELLTRLAEQHDVALFIDDLQWGDVDSATLLADILRPPRPPSLLLVACFRSEEEATSPFLRAFLSPAGAGGGIDVRDVPVGMLSEQEARELTVSLLGSGADAGIDPDDIVRESGGNPYFLSELVRYAQAGIEPSEAGRAARAAPGGTTLDDVIRSRVNRLPEGARRLLEMLAVAGAPLGAAFAVRAAGVDSAGDSVDVLRGLHLIRTRTSGDREEIEPYHDRIREAVVAELSPESLRADHLRLAISLESSQSTDPEALALHFQEAGEPERAAEYAAEAAQRAADALAFERAARLYRVARELRGPSAGETRRMLSVRLGDALANAGRGAEAAQAYLEAVGGSSETHALELERRAAEQYLSSGHIREGVAALRTVLDKVGLRMAGSPRSALISMICRRAMLRLRGIRYRERDASRIPAATLARIDACWSAAKGLILSDLIRGNDFQARHALLALRAGEPYRVSRALAIEAANSGQGGGRSRTRTAELLDVAIRIARRIDHPHAIGFALSVAGVTSYLEGRWQDARDLTGEAGAVLRERCHGVAWDLDNTNYYSLLVLFFLGQVKQLVDTLPALLNEAQARGDLYAVTSMRTRLSYLSRLANDEPDTAREELRDAIQMWPSDVFHLQHWYETIGQVECLLYAGTGSAAWRLITERWPALARSFYLRAQSILINSLFLRARAGIAAAAGGSSDPLALEIAEKDTRRMDHERMPWGVGLARLLHAGIASVRRRIAEASRDLEAAEREFSGCDMALHAAVARRRRGQLEAAKGGASMVASADAWMSAQGIRNPARMAAMLAPGAWS